MAESPGIPISIPAFALVALAGASDGERAAFARRYFAPDEVFGPEPVEPIAERLARRELTVVDGAPPAARGQLAAVARLYHARAVALVLGGELAPDAWRREGFRHVHAVRAGTAIVRVPLPCDRRDDHGPFDIIGDVHGCRVELEELLARLGWARDAGGAYAHPAGRRLVFLGDLVDRGPESAGVLGIVLDALEAGRAYWAPGNHDHKLYRYWTGHQPRVTAGFQVTLAQLDALPAGARVELAGRYVRAYAGLPSHLVLDDGALVVAHAGLPETMIGRDSGAVRAFALYGAPTGALDALGQPVRMDWAADYRGAALVAYGHTVVPEARWVHNTINLDQGVVFGGALTALRYPERDRVSVGARRAYYVRGAGGKEQGAERA